MVWVLWFVVPAFLLSVTALSGARRYANWWRAGLRAHGSATPTATVIVPVKGHDDGLAEHLAALASQDYPDYELLVTVWNEDDLPAGVLPPEAHLVVASEARLPVMESTGEKVKNLMAAVKASRASSRVLVFADSDGLPAEDWLRSLVATLDAEGVGVSTGFRVFLPRRPGFWSLLRTVWDAVILGSFAPGGSRLAWGGAMAIRREDFDAWRVFDYWNGAVSDDYRLATVARRNGKRIEFSPRALVANTSVIGGKEFFGWIRRQAVITRIYHPQLWILGTAAHILYCASMALCIVGVALKHWWLLAPLGLQVALGSVQGFRRMRLLAAALPGYGRWFRFYGWAHPCATTLATWLWLYALLAAALSNHIVWRGVHYHLSRPPDPPARQLW